MCINPRFSKSHSVVRPNEWCSQQERKRPTVLMARPSVIAFVGTVGSGKSIQMGLLARELKARGRNVRTTFLKSNHLLAYMLVVALTRSLFGSKTQLSAIATLINRRPILFRKLFKLWLALDVFSLSIKFLASIYLPVKLGWMVLVEEYVPATVVDYLYLSDAVGLPGQASAFASRILLGFLRLAGPTQVVFLDADDNVLRRRWKTRGSLEEKPQYIQMQRTALLKFSKRLSTNELVYIDTTDQMRTDTHRRITKIL